MRVVSRAGTPSASRRNTRKLRLFASFGADSAAPSQSVSPSRLSGNTLLPSTLSWINATCIGTATDSGRRAQEIVPSIW